MAYTLIIPIFLAPSHAGLTLNGQLIDATDNDVGGVISTGFTEVTKGGAGNGDYLLSVSIPDDHVGGVKVWDVAAPTVIWSTGINPTDSESVAAILTDTDTTIPALIAALNDPTAMAIAAAVWAHTSRLLTGGTSTITVVSAVSGSNVTVYAYDTWSFTITDTDLDLDDYEMLAFVVSGSGGDDDDAILYVRKDTGLVRIGGAAPTASVNGSLTNTTTSFTVLIAIAETGITHGSGRKWFLKAWDTTPATGEGYTLAKGTFNILQAGLKATA